MKVVIDTNVRLPIAVCRYNYNYEISAPKYFLSREEQ